MSARATLFEALALLLAWVAVFSFLPGCGVDSTSNKPTAAAAAHEGGAKAAHELTPHESQAADTTAADPKKAVGRIGNASNEAHAASPHKKNDGRITNPSYDLEVAAERDAHPSNEVAAADESGAKSPDKSRPAAGELRTIDEKKVSAAGIRKIA